ncbi:hypothetical protein P3L51_26885 [Streptomyces sp. PSRA5]|uniref:hypothetical protein n=1 Tax=Streptomyces panacea TaxID=3035064 RepID=UPI00339C25CB
MNSEQPDAETPTRLRPADLEPGAVVAQSLDNQWVGADLARKMMAKGKSLSDVQDQRNDQVRAEYFRSLINTRQIIVNRVFFYNNPAVSRDLSDGGEARRAHQELLADGTLVPFLVGEREPTDRPANVEVDEAGFEAWCDTVAEMPATKKVTCLRMSWNDQENVRHTKSALINPFAARVQGLTAKDIPLLASQLGVPVNRVTQFAEKIGEVVDFSNQLRVRDATVSRNVLYQKFVCVDGTPVTEGRYDGGKPFAGEVKQLLDLVYNVNLADALGMYPLTPTGSLRRVALQEWRDVRANPTGGIIRDPALLVKFLQRQAFSTVQDRLTPAAIDTLALEDVRVLRQSDEWHHYMAAFTSLTGDPDAFQENVRDVFDRYVQLNSKIRRVAEARRGPAAETNSWSPVAEVVLTIGGAVFTAMTGDEAWAVGASVGVTTMGARGGSVQLIVRNRVAGRREQKFAREIASVRLDAEEEWTEFLERAREIPGFTERHGSSSATSSTTIQESEEVPEY